MSLAPPHAVIRGLRQYRGAVSCRRLAPILFVAFACASGGESAPAPSFRVTSSTLEIPVAGSPSRGPVGAPVVVVEFADFYCPYCRTSAPEIDRLIADFPDDVRHVFKYLPFVIAGASRRAALAAVAADRQGRFWEMRDILLSTPKLLLTEDRLAPHIAALGLDATRFAADLRAPDSEAAVAADVALGRHLGVIGTPTFYVNGRLATGGATYDELREAVVDAMSRARSAPSPADSP